MKLYLIEAKVDDEPPYTARKWVTSKSDAAAARNEFNTTLQVLRKDIKTTEVEVDTRKDGLVPLLNHISNKRDGFFELGS